MTSESTTIDGLTKLDNVLFISGQQVPEALILQAKTIFNEIKIHNVDIKSLTSTSIVKEASYIIIDELSLDEHCDKEQLTLALNIPTLFINFASQNKNNDIECSYCWLDWPCETSTFKSTLAFSAYKVSVRKKLLEENNLLKNTMSCVGDILIYLDAHGDLLDCNEQALHLFAFEKEKFIGKPWYYLLQVKRDLAAKQTQQFIFAAIKSKAVTKIQPLALKSHNLLDGIIGPIEYSNGESGAVLILRKLAQVDDLSEVFIPSSESANQLDAKSTNNILLITPDNFRHVNQQYNWGTGDLVLDEIESRIRNVIRTTDLSVRYNGASFLVLLYDTEPAQTHNLLNQLMNELVRNTYLNHDIALTFSFGIALNNELVRYTSIELFYFANFALSQAKELGGNQSRQWTQQNTLQQIGNFDRVNGGFLSKGTADYQKMLQFWIILNEMGHFGNKIEFAREFTKQLLTSLKLENVALFECENDNLSLLYGVDKDKKTLTSEQINLSKHQKSYISQVANVRADAKPFTSLHEQNGIEVLVPIKVGPQLIGLIKIISNDEQAFAVRDHNLLSKIANHVALTIKNFKHESKVISGNSDNIPSHHGNGFWYSSNEMRILMQEVRMAAPTNATVLITGESGTGKELLAKKIHELSDRKTKPFVIFDCGTVVESLIDSELFGHLKGAFTGADKGSGGCIEQAEGGTLFLDEIGELPIHVQVKLLRFVQEKQYSKVGCTKYRSADIRVIAATNVNLEQQIKKGLFREDLYYRINVIKIESLPLRERINDVLLIAENYLSKYSAEYGKNFKGLTDEAKQALIEYNWPGNIRELKNLIHRASIMCSDKMIGCSHLGLYPSTKLPADTYIHPQQDHSFKVSVSEQVDDICQPLNEPRKIITEKLEALYNNKKNYTGGFDQTNFSSSNNPTLEIWQELVSEFIAFMLNNSAMKVSLTFLFEKELYQISLEQCQLITLQAANKLNIAESTFRRRWKILQTDETTIPDSISSKVHRLAQILFEEETDESKITLVQHHLVNACVGLGVRSKVAAKLFKVSLATYRSLVKKLAVTT